MEWINVTAPTFGCEVMPRDTEMGDDIITEEVGIVIAADSVVVIEGPTEALSAGIDQFARQVSAAEGERLVWECSLTTLNERLRAWGNEMARIIDGPFDWESCSFTCTEADAMAGLLRAIGQPRDALDLVSRHSNSDEEGDRHYRAA